MEAFAAKRVEDGMASEEVYPERDERRKSTDGAAERKSRKR